MHCRRDPELTAPAAFELPNKVLRLARFDHVLWVQRLANMLVGKEGLRVEELADCHSCRLGKWYGSCRDPALLGDSAFRRIAEPHRRVHGYGRKAVATV